MKHVVEVQSLVVDKNGRGSWSMDLQGMTCSLNPGDHVAEMEACGRSLAPSPLQSRTKLYNDKATEIIETKMHVE